MVPVLPVTAACLSPETKLVAGFDYLFGLHRLSLTISKNLHKTMCYIYTLNDSKNKRYMFEQLKNTLQLSNDKWADYISCFKPLRVAAKTILLKEGEISKKVFLIEKGCIRVWFNNNGKDLTFQFFFENSTVASIESFRKKIPSPVTIETIETSVLWYIHKKDIDRIIAGVIEIPAIRDKFIDTIFERTFDYMKHFFSFIKDSPEERYLNLIQQNPHIVKRVPQHYIASYLGISTVHLSRIKNKLANRKKTV